MSLIPTHILQINLQKNNINHWHTSISNATKLQPTAPTQKNNKYKISKKASNEEEKKNTTKNT